MTNQQRYWSMPAMLAAIIIGLSLFPAKTMAKLVLLPPNQMILQSDLIIVADVLIQKAAENQLVTTLGVAGVVKGEYPEETLTISQTESAIYGVLNRLPAEGRIFLLLQKTKKGWLPTGDVNAIAEVKGTTLTTMLSKAGDTKAYLTVYQKYFDQNLRKPLRNIEDFNQWGAKESIVAILVGVIVLINVYLMFFKRRRG